MWSVWVGDVEHRLDGLTLDELDRLEQTVGCPVEQMAPDRNAAHARALAAAVTGGTDVGQLRLSDIRRSERDLPAYWTDGLPSGGRTGDGWVVKAVRMGFTPHQLRSEFTLRDLQLLSEAST